MVPSTLLHSKFNQVCLVENILTTPGFVKLTCGHHYSKHATLVIERPSRGFLPNPAFYNGCSYSSVNRRLCYGQYVHVAKQILLAFIHEFNKLCSKRNIRSILYILKVARVLQFWCSRVISSSSDFHIKYVCVSKYKNNLTIVPSVWCVLIYFARTIPLAVRI